MPQVESRPAETAVTRGGASGFLLCFSISLFVFAFLRGPFVFWRLDGANIVPSGTYLAVLAAIACAAAIFLRRRDSSSSLLSLPGFASGLLIVFVSDWLCHRYSLFQAPSVRGELILAGIFAALLYGAGGIRAFLVWPFFGAAILSWSFLEEAGGRVIFSDDHASVFYRLTLLKEHFPQIPVYNTLWNAGTDQRDFFSTGIINLYLLAFPLLELFATEQVYNLLVAVVLFGLLPVSCYFALRFFEQSRLSGAFAAALSFAPTLTWFRWALKYGAMGFITSAALVPLNLALALRITDEERPLERKDALLFCATFSLMLLWSPTGLIFLPLIAVATFRAFRLLRKPGMKLLLAGLLAVNLPWIAVWMTVADVYRFVLTPAPSASEQHDQAELRTREGAEESAVAVKPEKRDRRKGRGEGSTLTPEVVISSIRAFTVSANPVLLFLGFPGILLFARRRERGIFFLTAGWLFVMGTVLAPLKPQLELDRMLVVLAIVLCLPSALAIESLLISARASKAALASFVAAAAFLITGTASASGILRNRSLEVFYFTDRSVTDIVDAIREHGGSGRVLFSGFVLHELNHGHLAPLAYYSGHPIVASSPVHNTWWYTDVIPEYYRDAGVAEVERYLDAMNVTAVMAHEQFWREYFQSQPWLYRFVWEGGRFKMYERLAPKPSYFAEGTGEILEQGTGGLTLRLDSPDAVIKFHYLPFLEASACSIAPEELPGHVELIRLRGCPTGTPITIKAKSGLRRAFS